MFNKLTETNRFRRKTGRAGTRLGRFVRNEAGVFATMFTLVFVVLVVSAGMAIDYALAVSERQRLQNSLDAALLAGGRHGPDAGEMIRAAEIMLNANLEGRPVDGLQVEFAATENMGGLRGRAEARYRTHLLGIVGMTSVNLAVESEIRSGTDAWIDVALVLDNTASLGEPGLQALKTAARQFRDSMYEVTPNPDRIQVAVVPFAGAVNVGRNFPNAYLDRQARSQWHAQWMEGKWVAVLDDCNPAWGDDEGVDPGDGTVEGSLQLPGWLENLGTGTTSTLASLLGIPAAHAQSSSPLTPQQAGLPSGWGITFAFGCHHLVAPHRINNFDLFDGIGNIQWAGCVEARPEPYDVTDHAPAGSNWNTYFVPYFWPDEGDAYESWVPAQNNDYMPDHGAALPWNPQSYATFDYWGRSMTPTTYDGRNATLRPGGEYVSGPNRGCPQPLLPLTERQDKVNTAINSMQLVDGGGTVISEGVAWGWRVLSPSPPFTEASAADGAKRIMVVMSDGENQLSRNPRDPGGWGDHRTSATVSDYNAYGYLRYSRFRTQQQADNDVQLTFEEAEASIDQRMSQVCANAKADDVEIYTVLFRSTERRAINALRGCASSPAHFYLAADAEKLAQTFANIGQSVGRLRLVR